MTDVFTMPPLYMYKGNITQVGTSNVWTITETWTPQISQVGSQVYCAIATDRYYMYLIAATPYSLCFKLLIVLVFNQTNIVLHSQLFLLGKLLCVNLNKKSSFFSTCNLLCIGPGVTLPTMFTT
jgi:hypothetical protein